MFMANSNPAVRRYVIRCWVSGALVAVLSISAALAFRLAHLTGVPAYCAAILPALPILWILFSTGAFLAEEKDEFQRNLMVQCLLGGTGGTLAVTTIWAYLEDFASAPRLDLVWVYPIFWLFVLVSYPFVWRRYR
ncbi:MAG: hypothetical protein ABSG51_04305 [Terracidiphilus sp.]|jgi:uncharacterized membrane protein